jgi:hypothetical protein
MGRPLTCGLDEASKGLRLRFVNTLYDPSSDVGLIGT